MFSMKRYQSVCNSPVLRARRKKVCEGRRITENAEAPGRKTTYNTLEIISPYPFFPYIVNIAPRLTCKIRGCLLTPLQFLGPVPYARFLQKEFMTQHEFNFLVYIKLRGYFSPQANYTDRATATCRRS
jgi:hypothetical protein